MGFVDFLEYLITNWTSFFLMDHSEGQLIVDTMGKAHKHHRNSDSASLTSSCLAKTMQIMSPNEDKKKGNNSKKNH